MAPARGAEADGEIIVVDADREVSSTACRAPQLACEFAALGLEQVRIATLTGSTNYAAAFRIARPRPAPDAIKPCRA